MHVASDVNKDSRHKAKAKDPTVKAKDKDTNIFVAKAKAKDTSVKAEAKDNAKDTKNCRQRRDQGHACNDKYW